MFRQQLERFECVGAPTYRRVKDENPMEVVWGLSRPEVGQLCQPILWIDVVTHRSQPRETLARS